MPFNSFQYWIFFFIVAALFYSVPFRIGKFLLLGASYIFYMWWDPRFIVLILTSTVVDYFLENWLETASGRRKKFLLVVSLVVNLGFWVCLNITICSLRPSDRALNARFALKTG